MKNRKYKVGDKIVELGEVFRIFKIRKEKNDEGVYERIIYFKPYYKRNNSSGIICSIPLKNINKTSIRKPISRKELKGLFKELKKKNRIEAFPPINESKVLLKSDDLADTVKLLKILYKEKKIRPESFSKSKKDVLDSAFERLTQEFALVGGVSLEKAKDEIALALQGYRN